MNIILFLSETFFLLWVIRNILFWVMLWQVKEYRFDRMFVHLKETEQGRDLIFSPLLWVKIIGIFAFGIVIYNNSLLPFYQLFVGCLFLFQGIEVVQEIRNRTLKRPVFTIKTIIITFLTLAVLLLLFSFPLLEQSVWILVIDRLVPFFIGLFVFLFSFPTEMYRDLLIGKATEKMKLQKKVLVIGITGSYGKSSTKEYVAQILKKKFRLLKTKGTNNTAIGVANTIIAGLQSNTEIFVVEMGAYKKGEIAEICRIVSPKIGILTAVNEQHASLFGSLEKTLATKYELIDALPKNGLALFNGNNQNAFVLYQKTKKKKVLYRSGDFSLKANIYGTNVRVEKTLVTFSVVYRRKKIRLKAPIIGGHNVENILPAIYLAFYLGMKEQEVKDAVLSLVPPQHTMARYDHGGISFIDDTFNANPQAVLAALEYMKVYTGKKIFVLQPMIELGKQATDEHRSIGTAIGNVCDYLLVTNKNYHSALLEGVKKGKKKCVVYTGNVWQIMQFLNSHAKRGDVVVFEGKEAGQTLGKIL